MRFLSNDAEVALDILQALYLQRTPWDLKTLSASLQEPEFVLARAVKQLKEMEYVESSAFGVRFREGVQKSSLKQYLDHFDRGTTRPVFSTDRASDRANAKIAGLLTHTSLKELFEGHKPTLTYRIKEAA